MHKTFDGGSIFDEDDDDDDEEEEEEEEEEKEKEEEEEEEEEEEKEEEEKHESLEGGGLTPFNLDLQGGGHASDNTVKDTNFEIDVFMK